MVDSIKRVKMTKLVKNKEDQWGVLTTSSFNQFPTIEAAADHLETLKVEDKEIDLALAHMVAYNANVAIFDTVGKFANVSNTSR